MKNIEDFKLTLMLSDKNYQTKAGSREITEMTFSLKNMTVKDFANQVTNGFNYCSVFIDKDNIKITDKRKDNFQYTQFISIDIDHSSYNLSTTLDRTLTKPTFAYNTFSNGKNNEYAFRFVYVFSDKISNKDQVKNIIDNVSKKIAIETGINYDAKAANITQYFNGSMDHNYYLSNLIYDKDDLLNKKWQTKYIQRETQQYRFGLPLLQNEDKNNDQLNDKDSVFIKDYWRLSFTELCKKYDPVMPNIQNTRIDMPDDDDTPFINIPENYREIKRYWYMTEDEKGNKIDHIRKIGDGNGRRHKLFINGIIRRLINPQITFENLLHNLVWEFITYMYNNGNKITKEIIWDIAKSVMTTDLERYSELGKTSRKWMVNPYFAKMQNLSRRQVINKYRLSKKQLIGEFYDQSLTDKENIKVMESYGVKISPRTLRSWRKENNIPKYYNRKYPSKADNASTLTTTHKTKENPSESKESISTPIINVDDEKDVMKEPYLENPITFSSSDELTKFMKDNGITATIAADKYTLTFDYDSNVFSIVSKNTKSIYGDSDDYKNHERNLYDLYTIKELIKNSK